MDGEGRRLWQHLSSSSSSRFPFGLDDPFGIIRQNIVPNVNLGVLGCSHLLASVSTEGWLLSWLLWGGMEQCPHG